MKYSTKLSDTIHILIFIALGDGTGRHGGVVPGGGPGPEVPGGSEGLGDELRGDDFPRSFRIREPCA